MKEIYRKERIKLGIFVGVLILAALIRCLFGTETTDEAMYIAEGTAIAEWGAVPYATNWFHSSGYAVAAFPFIKLYRILQGDLEGIFLFTRIMYTVVKIGLLAWGVMIVRKLYFGKRAVLFLAPLILFAPASISNFSYNTIPFLLEILAACYMMRLLKQGKQPDAVWVAVLVAIAVFFNPTNVILAFWWLLVLIFLQWKRVIPTGCVIRYVVTGIGVAILVCLAISVFAGGCGRLIEGLVSATKFNPYYHNREATWAAQWQYIRAMLKGAVGCGALCFFCYIFFFRKREGNLGKVHAIYAAMIVFCVAVCVLNCKNAQSIMRVLTGGLMILPPVLCRFMENVDKKMLLIWWLPGILNLIVSASTAYYGIADRAYLLLPGVLMITLLYDRIYEVAEKRKYGYWFPVALAFALVCSLYGYTYRDANIWRCTSRVESGIYKGLFTTDEKSEYLTKLEAYIKENTSPGDSVFAQQSFPALYLMLNGRMLAPTSWSAFVFADLPYTGDDYVRKYFAFMEEEPDVILYHYNNYGPLVNMEENKYPFCSYINENYTEIQGREEFSQLKIYRRKDLE